MRFQQVTAGAMAKGVEDTAFYSHLRLVALNEVGGDPGRFGVAVDEFHKWCCETQARRPFTLLATSTHDTRGYARPHLCPFRNSLDLGRSDDAVVHGQFPLPHRRAAGSKDRVSAVSDTWSAP